MSFPSPSTIQSGTLELRLSELEGGVLFEFENKKPEDTFDYSFQLSNDGSLEIDDITLVSDYTVTDADDEAINNSDFGS